MLFLTAGCPVQIGGGGSEAGCDGLETMPCRAAAAVAHGHQAAQRKTARRTLLGSGGTPAAQVGIAGTRGGGETFSAAWAAARHLVENGGASGI